MCGLVVLVVDCPFGRGGPGDVAYWLKRALKAATRAATTSLRRISSVVGRMLPTAGMRRRTPISPAQVSRMCRGCRPPRRTGDTGRPHIWCPGTAGSPELGCGRSRAGTALSRSSAQFSSGARRPLLLSPCRRSAVGTSPPSAPGTSPSRPGRCWGSSASLWPCGA